MSSGRPPNRTGFHDGLLGRGDGAQSPLWGDPQETEAARQALEIRDTPRLTPRERAFVQAVRVLYGTARSLLVTGHTPPRWKNLSDFPEDAEAALFYALSLMGTVSPEDPAGEQIRMRAGEIASEIYAKYPNHPGAAHYILHAFDDPENAARALDAARRYAAIAPERLTLCTCLRISSCNSGCGRRPRRRTKRRGRHRTHGCSRSIFPSASAITIACIGCSTSTCNKAATARRKPCSHRCDKASPSSLKMTRAT